MIKFFRKIRQKMLTENKFSKYLLYAIGEIILVVIGILIALQINNSNENLKKINQEQEILNNLMQDFEFNLNALEGVLKSNAKNIRSAKTVLNHTGNRFSEDFDIDPLINDLVASVYYYPKNGFLNDIINSGNLGIIRNSQLRNRLTAWSPRLDDLDIRQQANKEFENLLIKYIIDNGSWLNSDEATEDPTIKKINFPSSGFEVDNNDLLKKLEFENMVENQAVFLEIMNERLRLCLSLNQEILELLKMEIKK